MEFQAPTEALSLFAYHLAREMLPEFVAADPCRLTVQRTEEGFFARAEMGTQEHTASAALAVHHTEQRTEHVACAKALFGLYTSLGAIPVPYGTLVGVRPVKMAVFYLNRGLSPSDTRALLIRDYRVQPDKAALLCDLAELELQTEGALDAGESMLYLSIPFCPSRCRYCSFISQSAPGQLALLDDYLQRMLEELSETAELFWQTDRRLRAVYLGGGTPGLLSAEQLTDLFSAVRKRFPLSEGAEFTAELGRPDTITREKCEALVSSGIGRVCINPQTLRDRVLEHNGRRHSAEDFYRAFSLAREAGIPTVNTDLIAGLDGDSPEGFSESVDAILELSPENLTIHALCKKRASEAEEHYLPDEDRRWFRAMQDAHNRCINAGYQPYYLYRQKNTIANLENLGYAVPGAQCLYNIAMMQDLCDVFAVGAGAMTKIRRKQGGDCRIVRLPSYKYPAEYLADPEKGRANLARVKSLLTE